MQPLPFSDKIRMVFFDTAYRFFEILFATDDYDIPIKAVKWEPKAA